MVASRSSGLNGDRDISMLQPSLVHYFACSTGGIVLLHTIGIQEIFKVSTLILFRLLNSIFTVFLSFYEACL